MLNAEAHFIIHHSLGARGEKLLFYPQITLMTQIFWGVLYEETSRAAAETLKA
ncbi:MAG: hypothetical protein GX937_04015 [Lentisphaerae bacterium]|jgi:hypothetical protein|nr:hypothetical protein [Lentisphaerota bacterium]